MCRNTASGTKEQLSRCRKETQPHLHIQPCNTFRYNIVSRTVILGSMKKKKKYIIISYFNVSIFTCKCLEGCQDNSYHFAYLYTHAFSMHNFSCSVEWQPGEWEYCSATCGMLGMQQRVVSCVSIHEPLVPIDPQYCPHDARPSHEKQCNRLSCPAYWHLTGWTEVGTAPLQRVLFRIF